MTPGPGISRTPLPKGFLASGVNCGVRKYRPDLGIIISDRDAVAAGAFTQERMPRPRRSFTRSRCCPSEHIRAIITNSGQANAATGAKGLEHNRAMAEAAAKWVGCRQHQILTASTGVIGVPMEIDKIVEAGPAAHGQGFERRRAVRARDSHDRPRAENRHDRRHALRAAPSGSPASPRAAA